jgi:hypothetical protein
MQNSKSTALPCPILLGFAPPCLIRRVDSLLEAETLNRTKTISRLKVSSACVVKVAGNKRKIT